MLGDAFLDGDLFFMRSHRTMSEEWPRVPLPSRDSMRIDGPEKLPPVFSGVIFAIGSTEL